MLLKLQQTLPFGYHLITFKQAQRACQRLPMTIPFHFPANHPRQQILYTSLPPKVQAYIEVTISLAGDFSVGVTSPEVFRPSTGCAWMVCVLPLLTRSRKRALMVLANVSRLSQMGKRPTPMKEQKIQMIPTVTQPVKNFLLKM